MSYKIVAGVRAWSYFYHDGAMISNGNFTPEQIEQLKKRGYQIVDSYEEPPAGLNLIGQGTVKTLSPEQVEAEWAAWEKRNAETPVILPPTTTPTAKVPDPNSVKAAVTAGK